MNPIKHIRKWNRWRKMNLNSPLHKFLVLIGFIKSPTFESIYTIDKKMKELKLRGFTIKCTYKDDLFKEKE